MWAALIVGHQIGEAVEAISRPVDRLSHQATGGGEVLDWRRAARGDFQHHPLAEPS